MKRFCNEGVELPEIRSEIPAVGADLKPALDRRWRVFHSNLTDFFRLSRTIPAILIRSQGFCVCSLLNRPEFVEMDRYEEAMAIVSIGGHVRRLPELGNEAGAIAFDPEVARPHIQAEHHVGFCSQCLQNVSAVVTRCFVSNTLLPRGDCNINLARVLNRRMVGGKSIGQAGSNPETQERTVQSEA